MSLCIVGTVAIDSLESPYGQAPEILGGSGTFSALAASYFGPVRLISVVGADFPMEHLEYLRARGINTDGVYVDPDGATFRWKGRYGDDLNVAETLETKLGVLANFQPRAPELFADSRLVFLANCDPGAQRRVLAQMTKPEFVAADTMNFWIGHTRESLLETLGKVTLLSLNEGEARMLTGERALKSCAQKIFSLGPKVVVIKGGEFGAMMFTEGETFCAPAIPKSDVVDPTGAGDSFAGGMLGYLAAVGRYDLATLRTAIIVGSACASFAIENFGTERYRTLTHDEILTRFWQFRDITRYGDFQLRW